LSKVGKQPIKIPEGVTVEIKPSQVIVSGPRGSLTQEIRSEIKVEKKENQILVQPNSQSKLVKSLHGLLRSLIANMIQGVTKGFEKTLELQGVGYRVNLEQENLTLALGFSHPVVVKPPEGIKFQVEGNNLIRVLGIDKQLVGQIAAGIRRIRPPDSYKGKGIRYEGEVIKLKPGKAAKTEAAAT